MSQAFPFARKMQVALYEADLISSVAITNPKENSTFKRDEGLTP